MSIQNIYFCLVDGLAYGGQLKIMLDENVRTTNRNRQLQALSNFLREIHPCRIHIMKEWFDNIKQRRMATSKGRVKIKIVFPILQKNIAKMSITMTYDGHCLASRMKHAAGPLNQLV